MRTRVFLLAATLSVILAAVWAVLASREPEPNGAPPPVLVEAAQQLGVTPARLREALVTALSDQIEREVGAGRLSPHRAAELTRRLRLSPSGPELRVPQAP